MEEIKDLGGLVNKDLAFSKLPQGAVFDSENFRITTEDGNTMAARQNIKGTVDIAQLTDSPCVKTITFNPDFCDFLLIPGTTYTMSIQIGIFTLVPFVSNPYVDLTTFTDNLVNFLTAQIAVVFPNEQIVVSATAFNVITFILPDCQNISVLSFTDNTSRPGTLYNYYQPYDSDFSVRFYNGQDFNLTGQGVVPQWQVKNSTGGNLSAFFNTVLDSTFTTTVATTSVLRIQQFRNTLAPAGTVYLEDVSLKYNAISSASPSIFEYFPGGSYNFKLSCYVAKTTNTQVILSAYIYLGNNVNTAVAAANGITLYPYNGGHMVRLTSVTFPAGVNDTNYLDPNNSINFSFTLPGGLAFKDLINPGGPYNWSFVVSSTSIDTTPAAPNSLYTSFVYLDKLTFQGPPINLLSTVNVTTVANKISAGNIIGWTSLRDDIYLFTTDGMFDPDDPTTGPFTSTGQIWKFSYNKAGNYADPANYSLTLIYSNQLNFTTSRPIANPGMIEARYENPNIQKIYWTDNYNVPRQINVADPNVINFSVEQLNLQPALSMDVPVLKKILDGGALKVGVYQVSYRLKNVNGSETRFSRPSARIPIIDAPEGGTQYNLYYPLKDVDNDADKAIRVEIANIDTSYNTIEVILIYFKDPYGVPDINIVKELAIPNNGLITIDIIGDEDFIPIDINEFTAFNTSIIRAKTLAAKKQTLFLGNITTAGQALTFDSRAYRFPANSNTTTVNVVSGAVDTITYNPLAGTNDLKFTINNASIPETHDCIQTYEMQNPGYNYRSINPQNPRTTPSDLANYLYQPGTTILGGQGPNVKYEFFTETLLLDTATTVNAAPNTILKDQVSPGPNVSLFFNSGTKTYSSDGFSLPTSGSPYLYDIYVGYRRDEMYRFGIVFFDNLDNPTYVNWIADIRMPHTFMPDNAQGSNSGNSTALYPGTGAPVGVGILRSKIGYQLNTDFSSDITYYDSSTKKLYGKPLGVKFTIDFSSVPSIYKKASIVRVPLEDRDKHIIGQGLFSPTYRPSPPNPPNGAGLYTLNPHYYNLYGEGVFNNNGNLPEADVWTMNSPEFSFLETDIKNLNYSGSSKGNFPPYESTDYVDLINFRQQAYTSFLGTNIPGGANGATGDGVLDTWAGSGSYWTSIFTKMYDPIETLTIPNSIKNSLSLNPYRLRDADSYKGDGTAAGGDDFAYSTGISFGGVLVHNRTPILLNTNNNSAPIPPTPGGDALWNCMSYGNRGVAMHLYYEDSRDFAYAANSGNSFPGPGLGMDNWGTNGVIANNNISNPIFKFYISNYKKDFVNAFGGQGYFARANSEYILCNNIIDVDVPNSSNPSVNRSSVTTKVFGGDTIVSVHYTMLNFPDRGKGCQFDAKNDPIPAGINLAFNAIAYPVETNIAIDYRKIRDGRADRTPYSDDSLVPRTSNRVRINHNECDSAYDKNFLLVNEYFEVNSVFNYKGKALFKYFPKPPNTVISNDYDCRVWRSEKKIDGELTESWSIFKPGAFLDVESAYGPLNNLVVFQDKLYFIQDRGFGVLQVAEQKLISDQAGNADLVVGSSGILERYDYVSTKTGTKHQFSMSVSDYSLIWFDTLARKLYRYKPGALEPLTDVKGYSAFIYNNTDNGLQVTDNPYRMDSDPNNPYVWTGVGIHSTYDYRYDEFYMTFLNPDKGFSTTLVYNDLFDGFVGRYTFAPKVFINDKINIFAPYLASPNILDTIAIHNYGNYGRFYNNQVANPSIVSFVVNSNPTVEKTFTNLEVVAEAFKKNTIVPGVDPHQYDSLAEIDYYDFFEEMRVFDNYQNTDWQPLNVLSRRHKTIWNIKIPSDRVLDVTTNIFDGVNLDPLRPRLTRRMKDKWFVVDLKYDNSSDNKFVVHSAKALYSINSR